MRDEPETTVTDLDDGQVAGDQKEYAAEHLGRPDEVVVLLQTEIVDEDVDQADGEGQGADEQDEGGTPTGPQRLVGPPAPPPGVQYAVGTNRSGRVHLQHDGRVTA